MEKNLLTTRPKPGRSHDTKSKERRVAAYVRVSTEEQAENPEGSIKNQEERIKMVLALKNADTPFGALQGVYCDAGRSGKDLNRPELQRLLKAIAAREIDMVMVSELSRLTRSIKDFSQIWEFMQAHGCGFLSLRENFDTSTAAGEMMLYSIANFAQFERRQTSERVSAGFISRAQRGLWNGGVLPLGYEPDPENRGSLRIIEEEAKVVRAAFQALLTQGSVSSAAKWLNQNGYTYRAPLRGGGGRARHRHFTFDSLFRLLSNPAYAGLRVVKTKGRKLETVPAVWPAMIDLDTFTRAQKVLEAGKKQKTGRESRYPYLLSTRIYCGECGAPLVGISAHGATTKVPYYGHSSQIKREQTLDERSHRCNPFRVPGRKLEERVWKEVLSLIESPSHREPLFNAIQKLSESKPAQRQTEKLETELRATEGKLANLAKRIADLPEGVPAQALYDEMKRLAENQTRLKDEVRESRRRGEDQRLASAADFDRLLAKLSNQLTELSPETKRRIIQTLIQKVVVTKDGFELHFYAGVDQIKKGEVIASPSFLLGKKISGLGSFKYLNGGPTKNRTWNGPLGKGCYIHLTMGPPFFWITGSSTKLNLVFSGQASHALAMATKTKSLAKLPVLMALILGSTAWADQVVQPTTGKGWGDGASAESLLNMNRDPEAVRKIDPDKVPILISGSCTDTNGKTYTGEDEEYAQCMNHKSAKNKAPAPASVSKKN